ncbi:MAG: UvrD-helicase domain-containing protein [Muribaculaceae bacterium]|nr:UvrD-helicase domain-containing protein [Muribaculaceae bacterium]
MLKIQRASAGSGKTFTLAKKFILNLIAFQTPEGNWKLRNRRQVEDALTHVLAITFTNKATNEMKIRIVDNLSLLSQAAGRSSFDPAFLKATPYLKEFHEITGAPYDKIGEASASALKVILNNFSQFKISTIDSFFQEILRTFAYEASLKDSYQLEIDSTYVADAALDAAIRELDSHPKDMGSAAFWLKILMNQEAQKSQKWNLFNKKASSKSVYGNIRKALAQLESEDFKEVKQTLDSFFNDTANKDVLQNFYLNLEEKALDERKNLLEKIKKSLERVESILDSGSIKKEELNQKFLPQLPKIKNLSLDSNKIKIGFTTFLKAKSVFLSKFNVPGNSLDAEAIPMYKLLEQWFNPLPESYYKNWLIYGPLIPYLGLILETRRFLSNILKSNNLLQLSDTSFILKRIIGEDDAPFVFERLGNRIDHYLIDEFQDTSRMQWEIIRPLLKEGVSKNMESLIIGDPKQSIYRFRNADHTLITDVVPATFPDHEAGGLSIEENTNWRSLTRIVKFNNYFFKALAAAIAEMSFKKGGNADSFYDLYSNVVQYPSNQSGKGYVEISLISNPQTYAPQENEDDDSEESMEEKKGWFEIESLTRIGPLVSSLIERGYRQNEIAILVNTNEKGKMVVQALIDYNETLPTESTPIDFISEESLLISSSQAVQTIIGIMRKICHPGKAIQKENTDETSKLRKKIRWHEVKIDYILFSSNHPELSPADRIMAFLSGLEMEDSLANLMTGLSTPSLPSLVEASISTFIDEDLKKSEAIYLSSFQDLVTEYSASHHNDVASFLDWWESRGKSLSVTTPDGIEAVNIMTIHKSKGLEFKCVIIPFATDSFTPSYNKAEWKWVAPIRLPELVSPPLLPIKTTSALEESAHHNIFSKYYDQVLTDNLNMYYVAFTRARNELYIFTQESTAKTPSSISDFISFIIKGKILPGNFSLEEKPSIIQLQEIIVDEGDGFIRYGEPLSEEEIRREHINESKKMEELGQPKSHLFSGYYVNSKRPRLRSVAGKTNE